MSLEGVQDSGTGALDDGNGCARNVYGCDICCIVAVENVWANKGIVWVMPDMQTIIEK